MVRSRIALTALTGLAIFAATTVAAPDAQAQWRRYGYGYRGYGPGAIVGGAVLGLGIGALLAAPAYAPPPVVYAPPPAYYPPPAYAYAPAYPAPYYPPPGYYR